MQDRSAPETPVRSLITCRIHSSPESQKCACPTAQRQPLTQLAAVSPAHAKVSLSSHAPPVATQRPGNPNSACATAHTATLSWTAAGCTVTGSPYPPMPMHRHVLLGLETQTRCSDGSCSESNTHPALVSRPPHGRWLFLTGTGMRGLMQGWRSYSFSSHTTQRSPDAATCHSWPLGLQRSSPMRIATRWSITAA